MPQNFNFLDKQIDADSSLKTLLCRDIIVIKFKENIPVRIWNILLDLAEKKPFSYDKYNDCR